MCTVTCPKGLDPQKSINELIRMVAEKKEKAQEQYL
jgi:succinate dehydrogenase/fumarate reductase-like Fe-S protein